MIHVQYTLAYYVLHCCVYIILHGRKVLVAKFKPSSICMLAVLNGLIIEIEKVTWVPDTKLALTASYTIIN